jgi:hypothetical protein
MSHIYWKLAKFNLLRPTSGAAKLFLRRVTPVSDEVSKVALVNPQRTSSGRPLVPTLTLILSGEMERWVTPVYFRPMRVRFSGAYYTKTRLLKESLR